MSFYNEKELGPIKNVLHDEYESFKDTPIYQILPLKYAISILQNKKLRFGNIWDHWEDPYELFMYKQNVYKNGLNLNGLLKRLGRFSFGQCWSINKDTDAMWRIYSPDKESVQIKTTFGKMMKVMNQIRGMTIIQNRHVLYTFIPYFGRVIYKSQSEIEQSIKEAFSLNDFEYWGLCGDSLFVKRKEFEHENEVRFIITKSDWNAGLEDIGEQEDSIFMDIEPSDFIEEIRIDPRANDVLYNQITESINAVMPGLLITKSQLYAFNNNTINLADTPVRINVK